MNQLRIFFCLIIFSWIYVQNMCNCEKFNNNNESEESGGGENEMNNIMYPYKKVYESIESNGNLCNYEESFEKPKSSTTSTVVSSELVYKNSHSHDCNGTSEELLINFGVPQDSVNDTTTIEVANCKYQGNITNEDSDEQQNTLIDFPFSVSIQRKGAHYASGALVGKSWILSVAGEFYNVRQSIKLFRARLGSVDCKRGGTVVPLKSIIIHPSYTYRKPNFDLALLRMAVPVQYSDDIKPISISNLKGTVVRAKFMTTYWPRIVVYNDVLPETAQERVKYNSMRVSTQKLIPEGMCTLMMKSFEEVLDQSSLCLKPVVTHHSVCMPDAGAPVIAEDGLWAITSGWVSSSCPASPGPTLSTRVSSYLVRSWLNTQLLGL